LLVVAVGVGDDLGELVVGLREQELVVGQVGLVFVRSAGGLDWIWDVRAAGANVSCASIPICCGYSRATSGDVLCDGKRMGDRDDVLHVQIGFSVVGIGGRLGKIRGTVFRIDKDD
jgi:hypothetical protein